jgi:microcystin-dependent protein
MATNCVGIIRALPYGLPYIPAGWMICDGTVLMVTDYPDLFKIIGNLYGGDGQSNFALPNMSAQVPLGSGVISASERYTVGSTGGATQVTMSKLQLPTHTHALIGGRTAPMVSSNDGTQPGPAANINTLARFNRSGLGGSLAYNNTTPNVVLNAGPALTAWIQEKGASAAIPISQPTMVMNYVICAQDYGLDE